MFRIIDRYIIRELLTPLFIGLVVFTFLLMIPPLADYGEKLIAKGVSWQIVGRVLLTLVPQSLAITIPISLLMGLLVAFGRLSADREWVALQACGVGIFRLLRPVMLVALVAWAATSYIMFVAVPSANQTFREIVYGVVSARAESEIKPRVFFEDFPNRVLYIRDMPPGTSGWVDVFLADTTNADQPTIFTARSGHMVINKAARTVDLVLENGTRHGANLRDPAKYEVTRFREFIVSLDPNTVFPPAEILKGDNEMTVPELRARAAELQRSGQSPHGPLMAIHRKFSIPVACFVFTLIGIALGLSSGRDSKLASFVPGIGVVFVYYVIQYLGQQMAKGQLVSPWLATWSPNLLLGLSGLLLLIWRGRSAEKPLRLAIPSWVRSWRGSATTQTAHARGRRVVVVIRVPQLRIPLPRLKLLDIYVGKLFLKVAALTAFGLLGIFYISTFIDLSDKLFKGQTTGAMLAQYFYYATPQFIFYIVPLSALLTAMVTIGILTKNSELIVMKACGLSLYRIAAPIVFFAVLASGTMFVLQEQVLAYANRRAEALKHVIRGGTPRTFDVVNRKWLVARDGDIYNYFYYDPRRHELNGLSVFHFKGVLAAGLATRTYVTEARFTPAEGTAVWHGDEGWVREFGKDGDPKTFVTFPGRELTLEPPDYFATEKPDEDRMTYLQLRRYITDLRASGVNVVPQTVALYRKLSFPLVSLIMTMIAVPFAVTTGRRGALYGIGVGIVLAVVYWMTMNTFAAIGSAGLLPPMLAAWAPNLIYGAGAAYLLLTVRT